MQTAFEDNKDTGYEKARGVPESGIEPAACVLKVAFEKEFFSVVPLFGRQGAAEVAFEHSRPAYTRGISNSSGSKTDA